MNLREIGWEGVDSMHVAQDRDQGSSEHDKEPSGYIKSGNFLKGLCSVGLSHFGSACKLLRLLPP
jgi:hypothetical protein